MEKQCKKCLRVKDIEEFYRHPQMGDGRLNKCKDCTRADVTENREKNVDYYRQYDRKRYDSGGKRGIASKEARLRCSRAWCARNRGKKYAHTIVQRAVASGKLHQAHACQLCGCGGVALEAHHEDYSKPLEVQWLCKKCHSETWRKERREMEPRKRGGYVGRMLPTRAGDTR
jgi:hypothetical protein